MTISLPKIFFAAAVLIAFAVILTAVIEPRSANGSNIYDPAANVKVATTTQPGPQAKTLIFARNSACKSRVISVPGGNGITISLNEPSTPGNLSSTSLTNTVGHIQLGSSTVAYDASLYGCGAWYAAAPASTTITVTELQ